MVLCGTGHTSAHVVQSIHFELDRDALSGSLFACKDETSSQIRGDDSLFLILSHRLYPSWALAEPSFLVPLSLSLGSLIFLSLRELSTPFASGLRQDMSFLRHFQV